MTDAATLERARKALDAHAWEEAYEALASLEADGGLGGEDLQRLAEAAWWSAHPEESLGAYERAYAAYVAEGNPRRAGFVAVRLALEHADRMELAQWNGWLQHAIRQLDDQPDCVEKGFLEIAFVRSSFDRGAIDEAGRHAVAAREIGKRFGNADLEAYGLVLEGAGLVFQTQFEEGFRLIDEGTLAAVRGDLSPFTAGSVYCVTITVCRSAADYRRAGEWTEAVARWCGRQSITGFPGMCRVQRAEIMRLRGAFSQAEEEARRAVNELTAFGRLPQAGAGAYEIGEIRFRLGDLEAAEHAFAEAHRLGYEPEPGLSLVRLAQNRVDAARSAIALALADATDPINRARLLSARVDSALAAYDVADAREAAEELREIASTYDKPMLHAAAHQALGAALTYEEAAEAAVTELRRAVRHWTEADAPFEAGQARRSLAVAYRLAGDETAALLELRTAKAAFEGLGARLEAERCDEMIRAGREGDAGRRVVRTFMFTDIVGSTDLVGTIGDAAWENVIRWHDETMRSLIGSHRGEVVDTTGDGFFAAFGDQASAVACAVAIQRRLAEHRRRHGFAPAVRIGLHSAEATRIADDYAGLGVHEAARVGALADGGEILATASTFEADGGAFAVSNEREVSLKGIAQPVHVVSIEWRA